MMDPFEIRTIDGILEVRATVPPLLTFFILEDAIANATIHLDLADAEALAHRLLEIVDKARTEGIWA